VARAPRQRCEQRRPNRQIEPDSPPDSNGFAPCCCNVIQIERLGKGGRGECNAAMELPTHTALAAPVVPADRLLPPGSPIDSVSTCRAPVGRGTPCLSAPQLAARPCRYRPRTTRGALRVLRRNGRITQPLRRTADELACSRVGFASRWKCSGAHNSTVSGRGSSLIQLVVSISRSHAS